MYRGFRADSYSAEHVPSAEELEEFDIQSGASKLSLAPLPEERGSQSDALDLLPLDYDMLACLFPESAESHGPDNRLADGETQRQRPSPRTRCATYVVRATTPANSSFGC